jgi:hypothetical protein
MRAKTFKTIEPISDFGIGDVVDDSGQVLTHLAAQRG